MPEERHVSKNLPDDSTSPPGERPPLGSWRKMYALVLGNLALLIVLFYLFTLYFD